MLKNLWRKLRGGSAYCLKRGKSPSVSGFPPPVPNVQSITLSVVLCTPRAGVRAAKSHFPAQSFPIHTLHVCNQHGIHRKTTLIANFKVFPLLMYNCRKPEIPQNLETGSTS